MASWNEFETDAPDLARAVRARFEATKHHVLAGLRKDGSPRVSGTEVDFVGGEMTLGSMPGAVKGRDLKRDGRFALHANPGDGSMEGGDSKLAGVAVQVPNPHAAESDSESESASASAEGVPSDADFFRLDISEVVHTSVQDDALLIQTWRPGEGVREIRRK
jgi:hypothetical protein